MGAATTAAITEVGTDPVGIRQARFVGEPRFLEEREETEIECVIRRFSQRKKQGFQDMKIKLIGLALAGALLVASPASAMVLSVTGGTADSVPSNFNPTGFPGGVSFGDPITVFGNADAGFGLSLSSAANVGF